MTTFSSFPPAPQRTDAPDIFATKADAHVEHLSTFVSEGNLIVGEVNAALAAAGITFQAGDAGKLLQVNSAGDGLEVAPSNAQTNYTAPTIRTAFSRQSIGPQSITIPTGFWLIAGGTARLNQSDGSPRGDIHVYNQSGFGHVIGEGAPITNADLALFNSDDVSAYAGITEDSERCHFYGLWQGGDKIKVQLGGTPGSIDSIFLSLILVPTNPF